MKSSVWILLAIAIMFVVNIANAHSPDDDIRTTVIDEGMQMDNNANKANQNKKQMHTQKWHKEHDKSLNKLNTPT